MVDQLAIVGDKLYQKRAREAFPLLVRQARAEKPITYSDLADELGMSNPRNLNYVLGAIGNTIEQLNGTYGKKIPPIQFLVEQKVSRVPGPGVSFYVPDIPDFHELTLRQRRLLAAEKRKDIYAFDGWEEILASLCLRPSPPQLTETVLETLGSYGFGNEESESHRLLKEFVARSPGILNLGQAVLCTEQEFSLPTGDAIDVLVATPELWVAAEIKPYNAPLSEVLRGIFQCVKYEALLKALASVQGVGKECTSVLVLGGTFPEELRSTKNTLGLKVIDQAEELRTRGTAANAGAAPDANRTIVR